MCFILEEPETRAITSRYSARDKATQFLISGLVEGETIPSVISLFKEDFRNKLVPGSS